MTRAAYDDHGSGPYAAEAAGARASGANMADNVPIGAMVEAAKAEAAIDPAKVFADAQAEKDPILAACKYAGYLEQAKGHVSRQKAFDAVAESGTLAGTLLRILREVRTLTPEGRADFHMAMLRRWLKQNKIKDLSQNVMDEIRRRFLLAEQQQDATIQAKMIQDAITLAVAHVPRRRFWWMAFRYSNVLCNPRSHERNTLAT